MGVRQALLDRGASLEAKDNVSNIILIPYLLGEYDICIGMKRMRL